ncbi:hypothetical protein [Aquipuribacter nitratireducens]|uniref:Uncharacterized protein n=1 Tax=Aquipuribacter nitratireducens TaxID=650104 RepID=A0ABW0GRV1_9MICO
MEAQGRGSVTGLVTVAGGGLLSPALVLVAAVVDGAGYPASGDWDRPRGGGGRPARS